MKIVNEPNLISADELACGSVVTIGCFDGMHLGHMSLVRKVTDGASATGRISIMLSFPLERNSIMTPSQRVEYLEKNASLDYVLEQEFNENFSKLTPEEFVREYLLEKLNCKAVVIGFNNHFGRDGAGNAEDMASLGTKYGFSVSIMPEMKVNGTTVSTTAIKSLLGEGKVSEAEKMLGWRFSLSGSVVHGKELGRKMGFPTANIYPPEIQFLPAKGVYAVDVIFNEACDDRKKLHGMANLGLNPTVEKRSAAVLEVNIFDFDEDIYGRSIEVVLREYIRAEKKFEDVKQLFEEIERNRLQIKRFFNMQE